MGRAIGPLPDDVGILAEGVGKTTRRGRQHAGAVGAGRAGTGWSVPGARDAVSRRSRGRRVGRGNEDGVGLTKFRVVPPIREIRPLMDLAKRVFELSDEVDERYAENFADLAQFKQVQAARARFIVAHESLRLSQCLRHVGLAETGPRAET